MHIHKHTHTHTHTRTHTHTHTLALTHTLARTPAHQQWASVLSSAGMSRHPSRQASAAASRRARRTRGLCSQSGSSPQGFDQRKCARGGGGVCCTWMWPPGSYTRPYFLGLASSESVKVFLHVETPRNQKEARKEKAPLPTLTRTEDAFV